MCGYKQLHVEARVYYTYKQRKKSRQKGNASFSRKFHTNFMLITQWK